MESITYLDRIRACSGADLGAFVPWFVDGAVVGYVHRDRVPILERDEGFAARGCAQEQGRAQPVMPGFTICRSA